MKKEVALPFEGFYESIHNGEIYSALRSLFDNEYLESLASDIINFREVQKKYAERWAYDVILDLELNTAEFVEMISPKYYNFETDRIFISVELSELENIFKKVNKENFAKLVKERCTSCSGFISYYSNDYLQWGDIEEWDHNQYELLVEAWMDELDIQPEGLDSEDVYRCFDYNNDLNRLLKISSYLHSREER